MKIGADNPSFLRCYGISKSENLDPEKRPNAKIVLNKIENWIESYSNSEYIDEIKMQFLKSNEIIKNLPIIKQQHPDNMYTSKLINTGEIAKMLEQLKISQGISQGIEFVDKKKIYVLKILLKFNISNNQI
ncbi:hypothetical protein F8M41_011275 [Gigaspora margarita]|uniref:Uncharacterized protein n=1 Tax=Gigaspora margarita TaxID=4874 RepID=A0A8H4AU34_GIGMA|nr:hypothetical protein F8M41_011275 [Gigaspora margarita]